MNQSAGALPTSTDAAFSEVAQMIAAARQRAVRAVNTELVELYWQVGAYISRKIEAAEWGDGVVQQLADYLARKQPGLRGFTRANLFRMRQFYEVYRDEEKVAPLVRQLSWSHNLVVLGQSKQSKEREFYLRMAVQEQWSRRELERQIKSALFERSLTQPAKVSTALRQFHPEALKVFKDAYVVEFLDLAPGHNEADLHQGLVRQLKDFLIEMGRDFCFVPRAIPCRSAGAISCWIYCCSIAD